MHQVCCNFKDSLQSRQLIFPFSPESTKFQPMLRQCFLSPPGPDVVMSFEGKELNLENEVALPHGSIIELRCSEVGLFKFVGQPVIRCGNGQWNAPPPLCQPTSVQKNFSCEYRRFACL
ncbi:UNVERIFIED_CONTAM: hig [Trichonephila clavipes]